MLVSLGIETTAHTFGVAFVNSKGEVLSNVKSVYVPKEGGIHPREASKHHYEVAVSILRKAKEDAKVELENISVVAFSRGPGLGPCLRAGATLARAISLKFKKPLVGVNHAVAHLEIGYLKSGARDPIFLYVSGGNTQIISKIKDRYVVFGETEDIAVGNLLDAFARSAGLPFPGGPKIMELAKKGKKLIKLPYVVKGMNVSFSGTLTAAEKLIGKERIEDLAFSLQETSFSMLLEATERAMAYLKKDELVIAGGVGANERLREMARIMCEERGAKFLDYPTEYYGDNGAMIAWTGLKQYLAGDIISVEESKVLARFRIDDARISW
ncbi:MAG: bifunctional N(6)-L-threonylcarbamoyladenine synthase/serine/threonine protein kinase [Candidatus Brockarchaeota archaeon]|nr:bifunctional N(6)-L-threonylcarbamoyladenine synthase/serine/threonine protein kinase [Candidatus Brockarchaeota archaeon]MBO3768353.1 bifunctional N(6)-L-threonylcarbamoyladenine synthase/serine/threonine protein kinase [Candidatus Brockarchaeota archaeon]